MIDRINGFIGFKGRHGLIIPTRFEMWHKRLTRWAKNPAHPTKLEWRPFAVLHQGGVTMKTTRQMNDELIIQKGMELLLNGLGPLETMQFLNIPREKKIDSVKRHRDWQKQLDQKQFFDKVFSGSE
jgi:hypothetical protein